MPIKKSHSNTKTEIRKVTVDSELKFSFKFFDNSDNDLCPPKFRVGYVQALMERLQALSSWTLQDFTTRQDKSLRNHPHDWDKTSRPVGFSHLNDYFRDYPGWQFCVSANEYGRVHGVIINDTFYVIWLDQNHRLYS